MSVHSLLDQYENPDQLKKMNRAQLNALCGEIRQRIVSVVAKNGGHLSSNLGVVELTVALHRTFSQEDRIIWDVGHQCYAHKILTGRKDSFASLRQEGGISGFTRREESPYDVTDAGHSTTSISTAVGLSRARDLTGKRFHVLAVIGDGSLTGGMAWEAMNDAGQHKDRIIVVLNDNEMSITRNVGAIADHLAKLRTRQWYQYFKHWVHHYIEPIPLLGKPIYRFMSRIRDLTKYFFLMRQGGVLFEEMGWTYMGTVDGHDIGRLCEVLEEAKTVDGPVMVHIRTQKGRGYPPAEQSPDLFHGVGGFDPETGLLPNSERDLRGVMGQELITCSREDSRICAITAAMPDGCCLADYAQLFPERFFDVGIAEAHAVTMASGLALGGMKPVVFLYATFAQRAYDQLLLDICLQKLPVVICLPNTGLCGSDGSTHQGIYAYQYLCGMPNLMVLSAGGAEDIHSMLRFALKSNGPVVICYAKYSQNECGKAFDGRWRAASVTQKPFAMVAAGNMMDVAMGLSDVADVYHAASIKPMDEELLETILCRYARVYVLEDMVPSGGLGQQICAFAEKIHAECTIIPIALPDTFVHHGTVRQQRRRYGLDEESIRQKYFQ